MKPIVVDQKVCYPENRLKSAAAKMWSEFFRIVDQRVDVAHWKIGEGTVKLSARVSSIEEAGPDCVDFDRIFVLVHGISEILNAQLGSESALNKTRNEYRAWVEEGIMEAFHSVRIKNKFDKFIAAKTGNANFAIVSAEMDWGLINDELSLLWTRKKTFTIAVIKGRQKAVTKKRRARKIRPKELERRGLRKPKQVGREE